MRRGQRVVCGQHAEILDLEDESVIQIGFDLTAVAHMHIRHATASDIPGLLTIYNDAVANTTAIWNSSLVDEANRLEWLKVRQQQGYPVLVAVTPAEHVMGYATFGEWRVIEGFKHTVEHSVYVHPQHRGQGLGRLLMQALIAEAQQLNKHVMVAAIEAGNQASIELHKQLGFVQTGLMPEVGTKFGQWLDLAFWQLKLNSNPPV